MGEGLLDSEGVGDQDERKRNRVGECVSAGVCVSYDMYCMSGRGDMARQCVRMCV